jgi:hypothetical protein
MTAIAVMPFRTAVSAPSAVPEPLRACAQLEDDSKRLSCYDREIARLSTQDEPVRQSPTPPSTTNPKPAKAPVSTEEAAISATVSNTARRADGRWVITLDNGQVWLQAETRGNFQTKPGDVVQVRISGLGNSFMHTTAGGDTRVTREQ